MKTKVDLNIIIEREKVSNGSDVFIATSSDINVFVEWRTIDEAVDNFIGGATFNLKSFP